jgi:hypothetical protein
MSELLSVIDAMAAIDAHQLPASVQLTDTGYRRWMSLR